MLADIRRSLILLRYDAMERGMTDLGIIYGWSAIRIGTEMLSTGAAKFKDPPIRRGIFQ